MVHTTHICLHDIVYTTFICTTFVYLFTQHLFTHLFTQHLITLGRSLSTAMFRSDTYRSHDFLLRIAFMLHGSVKLSKLQNTINTESPCCVLCHCFQEKERIEQDKERIEQDTLQQARDVSGEK